MAGRYRIGADRVLRCSIIGSDASARAGYIEDCESVLSLNGLSKAGPDGPFREIEVEEGFYIYPYRNKNRTADYCLTDSSVFSGKSDTGRVLFEFSRDIAGDGSVSRHHFLIVYDPEKALACEDESVWPAGGRDSVWLIDQESANGTYLNGSRISPGNPAALKEGDWIFASGFSFFFFSGCLISRRLLPGLNDLKMNMASPASEADQRLKKERSGRSEDSKKELQTRIERNWQQSFCFEPLKVEAPDPNPVFEKPSWFSCLGSSALIVISSMSSLLAMALRNPGDSASIQISAVTSLSMAAAFLGYGILNRTISIRSAQRKQLLSEREYEGYLSQMQEKAKDIERSAEQEIQSLSWLLSRPDEELLHLFASEESGAVRLPLQICERVFASFALPQGRYSQKKEKSWQNLEMLQNHCLSVSSLSGIRGGQINQIRLMNSFQKRGLIHAWLWMIWNPKRKWAEIGLSYLAEEKAPPERSIFDWHPAFWISDQKSEAENRLLFDTLDQFLEQAESVIDEFEWTIFLNDQNYGDIEEKENAEFLRKQLPVRLQKQKNITWIFAGQSGSQEQRLMSADPERSGSDFPGAWKDLLESWAGMSETVLRKTLDYSGSRQKNCGWDEKLYDPFSELADFRDSRLKMKIRLSAEHTWDLIEEGPHALIAGTTGSGKSEGLISVLLQLALYNSPDLLQIICIDFKGSALASVLSDFPHTAGIITNLEENAFDRLEKALRAELDRRQKLIREWLKTSPYMAGDLDSYNSDPANSSLSHLIIAVDEFAQLKSMYPSAMKMLQETARIGRSLGIHLILATQKPAGVVDEQIWTNAASHLCFKVASAQDSREMLGHEKAAELSSSGEFILQVISQDEEKQGRALYSRSSCLTENGFSLISSESAADSQKRSHYGNHHPKKTVQQRISDLILSDPVFCKDSAPASEEDRKCILHPDFDETDFDQKTGLIDRISHMDIFDAAACQGIWVLCPIRNFESFVRIIQNTTDLPVFSAGTSLQFAAQEPDLSHDRTAQAAEHLPVSDLWNFCRIEEEIILIVQAAADLSASLLRDLLEADHIHLIVLSSEIDPAFEKLLPAFDLRMASSVAGRDQIFALFQESGRQIPSWPLFFACHRDQSDEMRICLNTQAEENRKKSDAGFKNTDHIHLKLIRNPLTVQQLPQLIQRYPCLMGFERTNGTFKPVCWDLRPILIAYRSEAGRKKAEDLLNFWSLQNPVLSWGWFPSENRISVIDLPDSQNLLMDPANEKDLYQRQILFVGEGAAASQFLLKKQLPLELIGDAVLLSENGSLCMDLADCHLL